MQEKYDNILLLVFEKLCILIILSNLFMDFSAVQIIINICMKFSTQPKFD